MDSIGLGSFTILGSAESIPETSVQFSYMSAFIALAISDPVMSEPPLENVWMVPSGMEP